MKYAELGRSALKQEQEKCESEYEALKAQGLKLDMSRGKPGNWICPAESRERNSWISSAGF